MTDVAERSAGPGRRARLSREQVLQAALALADKGGLGALTMTAIGDRLGAQAMSLYRHVRNKDEILDGIVDLVFVEIDMPGAAVGWKVAMRQRAISTRAVLLRHPWAIAVIESRLQPGPANLHHRDDVLGHLRGAGFSSATATHAYNLLDSYIYGFVIQEESLPFDSPEELAALGEALLANIPADEFPNLSWVTRELMAAGFEYAGEFEFGLDLILDSIERMHAAGR